MSVFMGGVAHVIRIAAWLVVALGTAALFAWGYMLYVYISETGGGDGTDQD